MVKFNLNTITPVIALALWAASSLLSFGMLPLPMICVIDSEHRLGDSPIYYNSSGRVFAWRGIGISTLLSDSSIPFSQVGHGFAKNSVGTIFRCERLLDGEIVAVTSEWSRYDEMVVVMLFHSISLLQFLLCLCLARAKCAERKKTGDDDRQPDPPALTPPERNPRVHIPPGLQDTMPT
jgi:hypothetical protein